MSAFRVNSNRGAAGRTIIIYVAVSVAVTVAVRAVFAGMPWLWVAVMTAVTALSLTVYAHTSDYSRGGAAVLAVVSGLLGTGVIVNVWYYTVHAGGTDAAPVLLNSDSMRFWRDAADFMREPDEFFGHISSYSYVLAALFRLTGPSVSACCILSMAAVMGALVQLSAVACSLGLSRAQCALSVAVMGCVCYWLSMGCVLLKDAWVICAMIFAVRGMLAGKPTWQLALATVMLCVARLHFLGLAVVGLALTSILPGFRNVRATVIARLVWMAAILLVWYGAAILLNSVSASEYQSVQSSIQDELTDTSHFAYYRIFGDIGALPLWRKLLMTPVAACVQFFVPFPWNWSRDLVFGPTFVYAHFAYPGYLFGAVAIYFFGDTVSRLYRRHLSALQGRIAVVAMYGLFCWLVPCVMYGGTVSRYGLPALAMMAPAVAYTLTRRSRSRAFVVWMAVFAVVTAVVLVTAYHLQTAAMTGPNPLS